jgi:polyphosphate kinase 2 (PPK2 family)
VSRRQRLWCKERRQRGTDDRSAYAPHRPRRPSGRGRDDQKNKHPKGESAGAPASDRKLKKKDYERELARLQVELVKLQQWVSHEKKKICIVFEGRDASAKAA